MGSLSMLFYVVECFSVNLEKLAADTVRSAQIGRINEQIQGKRRFVAKALGETAHQVDQIRGLHSHGPEVRNKGAQLSGLVLDGLLQRRKASRNRIVSVANPAPQHVQLNFNAQKCLQYAIVEVTGNAGAFGFNGASTQMPQKEKIFKGRADMTCDALQPGQVLFCVGLIAVLSVQEKEAPDGMVSLIEGYGNKGMDSKLLLRQARQARKYF